MDCSQSVDAAKSHDNMDVAVYVQSLPNIKGPKLVQCVESHQGKNFRLHSDLKLADYAGFNNVEKYGVHCDKQLPSLSGTAVKKLRKILDSLARRKPTWIVTGIRENTFDMSSWQVLCWILWL